MSVKSNGSLPELTLDDFDSHGVKQIMDQVIKTYPVACCFLALEDLRRRVLRVKAPHGMLSKQLPFDSIARHHLERSLPIIICDASTVPRVSGDPLVTGPPCARFYVGAPLMFAKNMCVGTLCIMDPSPRESFSLNQCEMLVEFAEQIMNIYRAVSTKPSPDFANYSVYTVFELPQMDSSSSLSDKLGDKLNSDHVRENEDNSCE